MSTQKAAPAAAPKRSAGRADASGTRVPDVLQVLRERIARYELPPGAKLNEYELAKEFGVPRTRVRDAFMALEQRGLIERTPNRGAMVARLDAEQVFHIYDVREVLEGLCAKLATQNVPPESWQDLLDDFSGPVERAVREGDFDAYTEAYGKFRTRCIQAAGNPVLAQALDNIYEKTQVLIHRVVLLPGRGEIGVREHRAVLEAMRRGDAEAAEQLRRANIHNVKGYLERYMKYIL